MTLVAEQPQERAWRECEAETVAVMGTVNAAIARLVAVIVRLIATDGWHGHGIRSVSQWVTWKACVSGRRAEDLVRIATRIGELPACWALFEQGRLTEDLMVRIARRLPAERDHEIARLAPDLLVSQLSRILRSCPELPDGSPNPVVKQGREPYVRSYKDAEGWVMGEFCLPPSETPLYEGAMAAARDAEFRDRHGLEADEELSEVSPGARRSGVSQVEAFVRILSEALDGLDSSLQRTEYRGERHQVVLHHDVDPGGSFGPGQMHLGVIVPDVVARFLGCDARVMVASYAQGRLIGLSPSVRTPSRALRRAIERRDQGCTHPLCTQRRWLQIHHLVHWADGGLTISSNLVALCPIHHRQHHEGDFTIRGDPEVSTLRFFDRRGDPLEPPDGGPPVALRLDEPTPYTPPYGGPLGTTSYSWN